MPERIRRSVMCAECGELRPHYARGCCSPCYSRLRHSGRLGSHPRLRNTVSVETWLSTVRESPDECWLWPYNRDADGYGRTSISGVMRKVHNVAWEVLVGEAPEGLQPDHECHNAAAASGSCSGGRVCVHRACANPRHIVWRPASENATSELTASGINKRKTHCIHDHPLEGGNLYIDSTGARRCRTCVRDRTRQWRERRHPAS